MKIPLASMYELEEPQSGKKGRKRTEGVMDEDEEPDHHLRVMYTAWKEIAAEYEGKPSSIPCP